MHSTTVLVWCLRVNGVKREWRIDLPQLTSIQISDYCFTKTEQLDLIGLNALERVVIGKSCFTKAGYDAVKDGKNPNRRFCLKSCGRLRELKIGCYSFSDYSVCEIDHLPSLEVIEMGNMNTESEIFYFASLALNSDFQRMKWWIDLPSLKSLLFGRRSFVRCCYVAFESVLLGMRMMNRLASTDFHSTWKECLLIRLGWSKE